MLHHKKGSKKGIFEMQRCCKCMLCKHDVWRLNWTMKLCRPYAKNFEKWRNLKSLVVFVGVASRSTAQLLRSIKKAKCKYRLLLKHECCLMVTISKSVWITGIKTKWRLKFSNISAESAGMTSSSCVMKVWSKLCERGKQCIHIRQAIWLKMFYGPLW